MQVMCCSLVVTLAASPNRLHEEANVSAHRTDAPRHGAHPPKLNGCGKLQIVILSGKKFENSSTHDFAQHIYASYKPGQPCLAILIDTLV